MSVSLPAYATGSTRADTADLQSTMRLFRRAFVGLFLMSCLINILYLTGSFFMLEVYDRVLPSRSVPTLVALGILAAVLYLFQASLDFLRGRILVRIAAALDSSLNKRVFDSSLLMAMTPRMGNPAQPSQDFDQIKNFIAGGGPVVFFDLPWIPLYLAICFAFHPWVGWTAIMGAAILASLTLVTERGTAGPNKTATTYALRRQAIAEASRRNVELVRALGMGSRMAGRWREVNDKFVLASNAASDVSLAVGAFSRVIRLGLQSFTLAICAYLVINQQATAGVMIASSIIVSRALAPVEMAIGQWKNFTAARQAWERLSKVLSGTKTAPKLLLPEPRRSLSVENLALCAPGDNRILVGNITFELRAGDALGIIGRSGCGKSSLARGIVGVWPPARGAVRLDGAALDQWLPETLGPHIGYLPQRIELFAGSIAENIARFDPEMTPAAVIAAARAAGVHDLITRLPDGYETQVGEAGGSLSGGQLQRIALARALYKEPFLVVLDEPNSNLDAEGDEALSEAVSGVRARGGIVIVIAHRPSALASVNLVMIMNAGTMHAFGERDQMLKGTLPPGQQAVRSQASPPQSAVGYSGDARGS